MEIATSLRLFWSLLNTVRRRKFFILVSAMVVLALLESSAPLLIAAYFKPELLGRVIAKFSVWGIEYSGVETLQNVLPFFIVVVFAVKTAFGFVLASLVNRYAFELQADIGARVLAAYLSMSFDKFRGRKSGEILRNVFTEPSQITFNVSIPVLSFVSEMCVLVTMLLVAFYISPITILVIGLVFSVVVYFSHRFTSSRIVAFSKTRHEEDAARMLLINNSILGFLDIRFGNASSLTVEDYHRHALNSAKAEAGQQTMSSIPRYSLELSLVVLLLVIVVSDVSLSDSLHIATAFLAIGYRLLPTLNRVTTSLQLFKYGYPAISSLYEIISIDQECLTPECSKPEASLEKIELLKIEKMRPNETLNLFAPLNLELRVGQVYAISGPSGVGKSTLLHIISGMLPADAGRVVYVTSGGCVDDRRRFAQHVAYLDQAPYIAETLLSRNLLLTPEVMFSNVDVIYYMEKVGLTSLVKAIRQGVDPVLGNAGIHLSGGEKQRFGLVRALLQNKQLLLLDEPTAGLDRDSEIAFIELLSEVKDRYLVVMISHSQNVINSADRVVDLSAEIRI